MPDDLTTAVRLAIGHPRTREAVAKIYGDLAEQVARQQPLCVMSGRCCHFEDFGHRLYVTTLELAAFAIGRNGEVSAGRGSHFTILPDQKGCPYQVGKICTAHAIRPFGCRMFFCDATSDAWQREMYEHFHGRLKQLHHELDIPYQYVEWRAGLRALEEVVEQGR